MTQKPYFRDVWVLGQSDNGYPGAFPRGLIPRLKRKGFWGQDRLWMFSGSWKDPSGTTIDINPDVNPDIVCDCEALPLPNESYDFVMLDPPYSELEARELYDLPYCSIPKVVNEAARVCRSGGRMVLLHRLVPMRGPWETQHKKRMTLEALIGVVTVTGYTNMRALSVWRKQESLMDFAAAEISPARAEEFAKAYPLGHTLAENVK